MPAPLTQPAASALVGNPLAALVGIQYVPPAHCFFPAQANIYTGNGSLPVPGPKRLSAIPCLITGVWMSGHRQAVRASDAYTHIMLLDPSVDIRDPYKGNGQALGGAPDAIEVIGETLTTTTAPWRFVVFSFVTILPGIGRRKVVFLDERTSYATSILLKDTFTDTNLTDLATHVMEVGPGWTITTGALTINAANQAIIKAGTAADGGAIAASGVTDFNTGVLDVFVRADPATAGMAVRATDINNQFEILLSTTALKIDKVQASVRSTLASQVVSLVAGTKHTLNVVVNGNIIGVNVDGGTQLNATSSFNNFQTKHGIILHYDAGGAVYSGPVDNLSIS